jgi:hypothetical protein
MKRAAWISVVSGLVMFSACGDPAPQKSDPPAEPEVLEKLDSDDPEKFLEGVDEARDKYGKKP